MVKNCSDLSLEVRAENIRRFAADRFDLLVVGGGINGAGIARDAAARGLRVALVEKGDFASGTSSKSSKLIHGGLRYLEEYHFRLVRDACHERDRLRKLAPHLVRPLAFVFPVYRGDPVGLLRLELGMIAYDALAAFRNIRRHRLLTRRRLMEQEPHLERQGLKGATLYYDCWTDDARLTLETILGAHEEGAVVANYVQVRRFIKDGPRIVGAEVEDLLTGQVLAVSVGVVVNATGPWLDSLRRLDDPEAKDVLRATKGVHILVPRSRVKNNHAIVARSPRDGRILFIIPWDEHTLVGTTDTDFTGSPDEVGVDEDDIRYLLETVNAYFPVASLKSGDVVSSYAGLRPLIQPDHDLAPSSVPREEKIFESPSGLLSLGGGKLTTFRLIAIEVVDLVASRLGLPASSSPALALPGGKRSPGEVRQSLDRGGLELSNEVLDHVIQRYGSRAERLIKLLRKDPQLAAPLAADRPETAAEAVLAREAEMAVTVEDILTRRTHISLVAPDQSQAAGRLIAELLEPVPGTKVTSD